MSVRGVLQGPHFGNLSDSDVSASATKRDLLSNQQSTARHAEEEPATPTVDLKSGSVWKHDKQDVVDGIVAEPANQSGEANVTDTKTRKPTVKSVVTPAQNDSDIPNL